ncbi:hypothetical protein [Thalassobacillus sp. CUG 92003]|uniref:hypothetical protein n=1 Tax=Thalassobacillus sp. CUG 92003 TaxID=2736641 RepID=UPI0015E69D98|nr:hypothetical protein [Thalassobacillus sp. CUG 92003]
MKTLKYRIAAGLVMLPFLVGVVISHWGPLLSLYIQTLWIWVVCFSVYWVGIGALFAKLYLPRWKGWWLGNSVVLASFAVFAWQFIMMSGETGILAIGGLAQAAILYVIPVASRILSFFSTIPPSEGIHALAYVISGVLFSAGYLYGKFLSNSSSP